jgi:hypothetical protein
MWIEATGQTKLHKVRVGVEQSLQRCGAHEASKGENVAIKHYWQNVHQGHRSNQSYEGRDQAGMQVLNRVYRGVARTKQARERSVAIKPDVLAWQKCGIEATEGQVRCQTEPTEMWRTQSKDGAECSHQTKHTEPAEMWIKSPVKPKLYMRQD